MQSPLFSTGSYVQCFLPTLVHGESERAENHWQRVLKTVATLIHTYICLWNVCVFKQTEYWLGQKVHLGYEKKTTKHFGQHSEWKSLSHVRLSATPWTITVHGVLQARILEWVAFCFFGGSAQPRQVSCIAGGFFTSWATREAPKWKSLCCVWLFVTPWTILANPIWTLEKEMATHSIILARRSPWTEKLGGLQSMGSKRIGHDWAHIQYEPKWFLSYLKVSLFSKVYLIEYCERLLTGTGGSWPGMRNWGWIIQKLASSREFNVFETWLFHAKF